MTPHPLPPPRRRLLTFPLVALAAMLACFVPRSEAQNKDAAVKAFDIPADTADKSLRTFTAQSGLDVVFGTATASQVRTNAVKGDLPARAALDRLLAGTGLIVVADRNTGALSISRDPNGQRAAQVTAGDRPRKPSDGNAARDSEEPAPIELSPFVINADSDVGYQATNTLAGSRLNTSLRDTAATIGVLTSEFLSDIGATNLTEALEYGNNVQLSLADATAIGAAPNDNAFFNPGPQFRVRGIQATITRNYFSWQLPLDTYNVERIEEARGPNSILFGIGSAGGLINNATKQAVLGRAFRRAEASTGSFGAYRGTVDLNQTALGNKFGVRLNAAYDHAGTYRTYGFSDKRRAHLALKYQLTRATRLRAEYETGDNHENIASYGLIEASGLWRAAGRPIYAAPVAANSALGLGRYGTAARITYIGNNGALINMANRNFGTGTSQMIVDPAVADPRINPGGPGQLRDSYYDTWSVFLEHRLGKGTHFELAYNHQETDSRAHQTGQDLSFDPNLTLPTNAANPYGGRLMLDGNWIRRLNHARSNDTRLTVSTERDFGKWGNYRLAGMAEYEWRVTKNGAQVEAWAGRPFNASPENAANLVYRRNYPTEGDWPTYYKNGPAQFGLIQDLTEPVTGRALSSTWVAQNNNQQDDPNYQTTLLLGGQARYFHDRLVFGFGYRHDKLEFTDRNAVRDPATSEFEVDYASARDFRYTGRTKTLGVVAHVTRQLSLLYNRSDNFSLPSVNIRLLPDSLPGGNPEGEGQDMGVAITLLDGRLYARAVYYKSSSTGEQAPHGFGSSNTSPTALTTNVLDPLVAAGLITAAEADARRVTANGAQYDRTSEGYEFSLTANLSKNWRLQANYSITSSYEENIGNEVKAWADQILPYFRRFPQDIATPNGSTIAGVIQRFEEAMADQFSGNGEDVGGNRKHKVNFFTRYTFSSGRLKGAYLGGGYRHQSKNVAGRNGPQGAFLHGRSYWLADAVLGYRVPRVPFVKRLNLQLNVANLFDADQPLVTHYFDDGTIRRWFPVAPRTWRLSANVEF